MNNQDTVLTFIGTSAVQPEDGNESACFIVDDHLLVDVGWNAVTQMRRLNIDPTKVKTLILTHFHHDHYMGLPQLLFYLGSNAKLTVIGPAADLEEMVGRAAHFLQADRFEELLPELNLVPLKLGESTTARSYRIDTCEAIHPVPALSYRFTHQSTGVTFAYSGDTSFNEELIPFVKGCQLLIHESSYAGRTPPADERWRHASGAQAGQLAALADVPELYLVHAKQEERTAAVEAARQHHPNVTFPAPGDRVRISPESKHGGFV